MTSATEILRRMLDERGVEHYEHEAPATDCIAFFDGEGWHDCWESVDGEVNVTFSMTPEQAIAATLGAGSCKRVMDSIDPFAMWVCDHCGHPLDTSENFCGGCGRKVVDDG